MQILTIEILIQTALLLYLLSAVFGLVLMRHNVLANRVCPIVSMAASAFLGIGSLLQLFAEAPLQMVFFRFAYPDLLLTMRIDAISSYFLLALAILSFAVSLYSIGYMNHYKKEKKLGAFYFLYGLFLLSIVAVFTAEQTFFFYLAWEVMSVVSCFLVMFESEKEEAKRAAIQYIVMTHIAAAMLLIGFLLLYRYDGSFAMQELDLSAMPNTMKNLVFVLFLVGFGTKAGLIPLHVWLPEAHPAAPSNVSALMSGIMIKTAIYGLIRFVLLLFDGGEPWWGILVIILGIITAVLGVSFALVEENIKRLLAFSSVENIGILLIGLGGAMAAYANDLDSIGALFFFAVMLHTLNHSLFKGGLFLGAGAIQYATHTKQMDELGGLIQRLPLTSVWMLGFSLAAASLVPLNGFLGEWMVLQSLFLFIGSGTAYLKILCLLCAAVIGFTGAAAAACFVKFFGIAFLGLPRSEHAEKAKEVNGTMQVGMALLALLCVLLGLFPNLLKTIISPVLTAAGARDVAPLFSTDSYLPSLALTASHTMASPLTALLAAALFFGVAVFLLRFFGGKSQLRRFGTWDCGFSEGLTARMQYTGAGFSKPIKIVFRALYRTDRERKVIGDQPYFPEAIEYSTSMDPYIENHLYQPAYRKISQLSRKWKLRIQTGSVHSYLFYIFVVILVLLAYHRFA